jgi:hypothetical protein
VESGRYHRFVSPETNFYQFMSVLLTPRRAFISSLERANDANVLTEMGSVLTAGETANGDCWRDC